jgi:Calpain family cysteine protease
MSQDAIATWHSGELPLISRDTDSFDFASAERIPRRPQFSAAVHDSAVRDPAEALSVSHADATYTDTAVPGFLDELHNVRIRTDVADALGANDSLSYHGMLQVLDAAAVGGMTAGKFHTLETLASLFNAPDGITTSAYVQHVSHSLIDGDPANAEWTGGESTPIALGNLSATSTQAQVDDLIGKWFLGTDLPSLAGTGSIEATYEVHKGPLFAAHEAPSYLDVNQGSLGDCWFVATLAEVALKDPSAIESMITNNGNGTDGVRFFVDGVADYVTVNNELPTGSEPWANGSHLAFANGAKGDPLWAELVEKAFAELNAEPNAVHGDSGLASNAYEGIAGGFPENALAEITGQDSFTFTSNHLVADAATIGAAFDSGEEVELGTDIVPKEYRGDLVNSHVFEVIGYNASTDEFTIHNPWGSASASPMTFTMSAHELAAAGCSMTVAEGSATVEHAHAEMEASIASVAAASHGPLAHFLV